MSDVGIADSLNHRRRMRLNLLRPFDRLALGRLNCARALRTRTPHGIVALNAAFNVQLLTVLLGDKSSYSYVV